MEKKKKADLDKMCRWCESAHCLQEEDTMLCDKKGIVSSGYVCKKFIYDPLKREPFAPVADVTMEYVDIDL